MRLLVNHRPACVQLAGSGRSFPVLLYRKIFHFSNLNGTLSWDCFIERKKLFDLGGEGRTVQHSGGHYICTLEKSVTEGGDPGQRGSVCKGTEARKHSMRENKVLLFAEHELCVFVGEK